MNRTLGTVCVKSQKTAYATPLPYAGIIQIRFKGSKNCVLLSVQHHGLPQQNEKIFIC
jgi:hypothetical protein